MYRNYSWYKATEPKSYESEIYDNGLNFERPSISVDPSKWEPLAIERLSKDAAGYVYGSAGTRETTDKNHESYKRWSIIPNRLVKSDFPDLRTKLFGREYSFPIALGPVGVQRIVNPEGEHGSSKAATLEHVPYVISTAASMSFEEIAESSGPGERWYQLYWPSNENNDITASLLKRAKSIDCKVLVVTLDTYILGWRPSDMDNGYDPFLKPDKIGVALGLSDPVFRKRFKQEHGVEVEEDLHKAAREFSGIIFPGLSHDWEDLKFIRENWDGPIVLKGIQSVADAKKAAEFGVDGIVVSNHGGRQQDGGVASLTMLPKIVDAVGDKLEILFDSGIRSGSDIVKALALGAKMVLIGRPYIYGLGIAGTKGVRHVIRCLLGDLELTLHLSGVPSIAPEHLNRDLLLYEDH
ncbi:FMN-dependent alpha-hydroxy acid dehydrogenase [Schizosaccharomyces osmophilus]|uniref:FMN-dependent alpha-hydroxy acid dehydrogenase n=1 Tax=Schizosaccharomyces osmophilus TaxID=2545709 RepID=A0AAE9W8E9_9SCHI|nr:FMN-dependent alpha-hydroxy acid dehydrogenase [Schizosaccharomyces osmophilus]WBW71293.1 FMN-dependent alpha-hydroxy acid dehydrogenase [Schizosaccharomyces osmophilus]